MNIKTIVKVMNFHALLRVDKAHREADRYAALEKEVTHMIDLIQNNRNLILDKWIMKPPVDAPRLRIYIGSDLGFCGAVNSAANQVLDQEPPENTVILIGRKLHPTHPVALSIPREELETSLPRIHRFFWNAVEKREYSGIDVIYDHYYNMSRIEPTVKTIFPVKIESSQEETYSEDFSIEGNIDDIMRELLVTYLNYELKIALVNSFASENILRQAATRDSLDRIDEMEQEALWQHRKELNALAAKKTIDFCSKTRLQGQTE